jgi:hypothetical protein
MTDLAIVTWPERRRDGSRLATKRLGQHAHRFGHGAALEPVVHGGRELAGG